MLELFDLYLNIADLRSPGGPKGSDQASASSKVKSKAKKTYYSTSTTLAPHMFTVAVNSYAKVSDLCREHDCTIDSVFNTFSND